MKAKTAKSAASATASKVTIWHNPACGTSRNTLALLRERGIEPEVYLYLEEKPSKAELEAVLSRLKLKPSELLRAREPLADELGLKEEGASEAKILSAMAKHAILVQRPLVLAPKGAVIARPAERAEEVI
ncbi:MAG: arsenate reductase (glutaredoxin) [Hyphomonadaceae bacterium]|nr:arsenate reductase (glutaredoxin) [Hyphomonadaceae bacterium]